MIGFQRWWFQAVKILFGFQGRLHCFNSRNFILLYIASYIKLHMVWEYHETVHSPGAFSSSFTLFKWGFSISYFCKLHTLLKKLLIHCQIITYTWVCHQCYKRKYVTEHLCSRWWARHQKTRDSFFQISLKPTPRLLILVASHPRPTNFSFIFVKSTNSTLWRSSRSQSGFIITASFPWHSGIATPG